MADAPETTPRLPPLRAEDALVIGSVHPAKQIVQDALVRRGDAEGVAQGRALAIVDLLLRGGWLKRDRNSEVKLREECSRG